MKIVHFSDLHLDEYKGTSKVPGQRLEDCLRVLDDAFTLAAKTQSKLITFGGDWNNMQQFIPIVVQNKTMERLQKLFDKYPAVRILAIKGNHDFATKNLIDQPAEASIEGLTYAFSRFNILDNSGIQVPGGGAIYGIPYYEFPEHYDKMLDKAVEWAKDAQGPVTLLIHQTPNVIGNAHLKADTDVNDPRYDHFDLILCGHIHIVQHITPKFVLTGNPLQKDLSDAGLEKGLWVFEATDPQRSLKFVSRKGRYAEFKTRRESEPADPADENNIVTVLPDDAKIVLDERAAASSFGKGVDNQTMLRNYWEQLDGNDEELLQTGLHLFTTTQ